MAKKKKKKVEEEKIEEEKVGEEEKEDEVVEDNSEEEVVIEEVKDNDLFDDKEVSKMKKKKKHVFTNMFVVLTMISAIGFFVVTVMDKNTSLNSLINCSILVLFSIIYLIVCLTTRKKSKFSMLVSSILLCFFFLYNINNTLNIIKSPTASMEDFRGRNLTDVIKWANANNIKVNQDYEYSDMVSEYKIISQDLDVGSNIKDIDEITVSVSEGPNPYKEIIIPSMVTWDSERVLKYVKNNYLSNVEVEFIESDKLKDTVIEQDKSGNLKRNDDLKLTFSYGDEGNSDEVKLIDFTNKSKFEIMFYMKQHHLNYKFEYEFSNKVKKGYGVSQDIKPGETVKVDDKEVVITLSKGPKVKIPNLKNMSLTKLTEWAVKNKLKLEFIDKYDDSIKEGNVISFDKDKGDIVEQGTVIKVTLSRGKLKMPDFKNVDEFYEWADKYEIKYEIRREFSDTVKSGEVISYSVKKGHTIKNDEAIIVKISDGKNCKVPDLKGLSKSEATSKLKKANLEYNFVYRGSDKAKDKVIDQSISSSSEVSCGTTVTVTLSNGKKEESTVNERKNESSKSSNSQKSNTSNNSGSNNNTPTTPTKTCNECPSVRKSLIPTSIDSGSSCSVNAGNVKRRFERECPGLTVNVSCRKVDGYDTNEFVDGYRGGTVTSCDSISIVLAE